LLRRLTIAQLGTADALDEQLFVEALSKVVVTRLLPRVLRTVAEVSSDPQKCKLLEAASQCESEGYLELVVDAFVAAHEAELDGWKAEREASLLAAEAAQAAEHAEDASDDERIAAANAASIAKNAANSAEMVALALVGARKTVHKAAQAALEFLEFPSSAYTAISRAANAITHAVYALEHKAKAACVTDCKEADQLLSDFSEWVVQILVEMNSAGSRFLYLTRPQIN
jgi:hypothetical protein